MNRTSAFKWPLCQTFCESNRCVQSAIVPSIYQSNQCVHLAIVSQHPLLESTVWEFQRHSSQFRSLIGIKHVKEHCEKAFSNQLQKENRLKKKRINVFVTRILRFSNPTRTPLTSDETSGSFISSPFRGDGRLSQS